MDIYIALTLISIILSKCGSCHSYTRRRQGERTRGLETNARRQTDISCGQNIFISTSYGHHIQLQYTIDSYNSSCLLHLTTRNQRVICFKLDAAFTNDNDYDCSQTLKFAFDAYPFENYDTCTGVHRRICGYRDTAHAVFNISHIPNQKLKLHLRISTLGHVSKRSPSGSSSWSAWDDSDDWSLWQSWSSWKSSPSWTSWSSSDDWDDWSSWKSWSSWSSDYEDTSDKKSNNSIGLILALIFGGSLLVVFYVICCKWRKFSESSTEEQEPTPDPMPEYSSENDRHEYTEYFDPPVTTRTHAQEPRPSGLEVEGPANAGQFNGQGNGYVVPSITSLLDDYMASRDLNTPTHEDRHHDVDSDIDNSVVPSARTPTHVEPSTHGEDTALLSNNQPGASHTVPTPTISSLIDEYLTTRDYGARSDPNTDSPSLPATQISTPSSSSPTPASVSVPLPASHEETSRMSHTSPNMTVIAPTITSLIEEYLSTRGHIPEQERPSPTPPSTQHPDEAARPSLSPITTPNAGNLPTGLASNNDQMREQTITSLIDEYLATRHPSLLTERSRTHPTAPYIQSDEPPGRQPITTTGARGEMSMSDDPDTGPSITSLIDEYISTRLPTAPYERRQRDLASRETQTLGSDPPQYSDVVSDMGTSTDTTGVNPEAPPPSYDSLFGDKDVK